MEHEGENYTNRDWRFRYSKYWLLKGLENLEVGGRVETHQNYSISENGPNSE